MSYVRFCRAAVVRAAGSLRESEEQPNVTAVASLIGLRPRTLARILRCDVPDLVSEAGIVSHQGCGGVWVHQQNLALYIRAVQTIHSRNDLPTIRSLARELNKKPTTVRMFCATHRAKIESLFTVYEEFEARVYRIGRARYLRRLETTRSALQHAVGCSRMALYHVLKRHPMFVSALGLEYTGRWATRTGENQPHPILGARRNVGHKTRLSRVPRVQESLSMPERILRTVAARYGIGMRQLVTVHGNTQGRRDRTKLISMVAMYLIREETGTSFEQICEMFSVSRQAATNSHLTIDRMKDTLEDEFRYIRDLCGLLQPAH